MVKLHCIIVIFIVFQMVVYAGIESKLIANPGFESGKLDEWAISNEQGALSTYEVTDNIKRSGMYSFHLSKTNGLGSVRAMLKNPIRVEAGQKITLRFYFNSINTPVSSWLIPRLSLDNSVNSTYVPTDARHYDYYSQTFMRNAPSRAPLDWQKRVWYYDNTTEKAQDVFLQLIMFGNPYDVYLDDFEIDEGRPVYGPVPSTPQYRYSEKEVLDIVAKRSEESVKIFGTSGKTHFQMNGKEAWPVFYRGVSSVDSKGVSNQDSGAMGDAGIEINNCFISLDKYWIAEDKYDWDYAKGVIMGTMRKNPHAKLLLDIHTKAYREWYNEHPNDVWTTKDGNKLAYASYSSKLWRFQIYSAIGQLIKDMKKNNLWKIVVGVGVLGGEDGQFWTKYIGEYAADYSPVHKYFWHRWLAVKYGNINKLNLAWKSNYSSIEEIPITDPTQTQESYAPILANGPVPDFRSFCEAESFTLREELARGIEEEAGNDIFISAYGMPHENLHDFYTHLTNKNPRSNDVIASMSYYPYRIAGDASGYHPEQSFGYHNSCFMQELDIRSFAVEGSYNEMNNQWLGSQSTVEAWRNMHRKLVGISLAQDQGYWYYDMGRYFKDDSRY